MIDERVLRNQVEALQAEIAEERRALEHDPVALEAQRKLEEELVAREEQLTALLGRRAALKSELAAETASLEKLLASASATGEGYLGAIAGISAVVVVAVASAPGSLAVRTGVALSVVSLSIAGIVARWVKVFRARRRSGVESTARR